MAAPMSQSTQPAINPAIPPESHPQPSQSQAQTDIDPVAKVKILLLPRLKDSLVSLMKVAGQILHQNSLSEEGQKAQEGLQQMFEKSLEDFYCICDQLEINLRLALEMHLQQSDSSKFSPLPVAIPKSDGQVTDQQSAPYPQFLMSVKQQISCAKELYTMLTEFTNKLTDRPNIS